MNRLHFLSLRDYCTFYLALNFLAYSITHSFPQVTKYKINS